MEQKEIDALKFIRKYFLGWNVTATSNYGTIHGYVKLRNQNTSVKVYVNLNGKKYWTDFGVTVDHIEPAEEIF